MGLIGIGLLGSELAGRLLRARLGVRGFDLDAERQALFARAGGFAAADAAEVFTHCDRVILSLPSHREVEALLAANAARLQAGQIILDTTTGDPATSARLAADLVGRGVAYLDATVSGSSVQVREGAGVMMVGGDRAAFERCEDLFSLLVRAHFHTGPAGTGAKMKLATNLVLGLNRAALAEGLAFARALALDPGQCLAILRNSPAYSRIMDSKGDKMIRGDYAPEARLSQHLKDVRLIVEAGTAAGLPMPLSRTHREVLEAAEAAGLGGLDNSAVIKVLSAQSNSSKP